MASSPSSKAEAALHSNPRVVAPVVRCCLATVVAVVVVFPVAVAESVSTTVYVGKHFEVRDHDQPVKYVFNGDTRVARITGSLSSNNRVQRIRLFRGWNLVSLAVTATDLAGQFDQSAGGSGPLVTALYRWNSSLPGYELVTTGQVVPEGSVVWARASTNGIVAIRGEYQEPAAPNVAAGGSYVPGPGLERWPLQLPAGVTVWKFDAASARWQSGFAGDLAPLTDLPPTLATGDAIYVHSDAPVELTIPDPAQRVTYYHPDHLGSSTVVTDAAGRLLEETAYHPFGVPRNEYAVNPIDAAYTFTQKERDRESGLHYFEARYLASAHARFITPDAKFANPDVLAQNELGDLLANPQQMNLYSYVRNSPLKWTDPSGLDSTPPQEPTTAKSTGPMNGFDFENLNTAVSVVGALVVKSLASVIHEDPPSLKDVASGVEGTFQKVRFGTAVARAIDAALPEEEREKLIHDIGAVANAAFLMGMGRAPMTKETRALLTTVSTLLKAQHTIEKQKAEIKGLSKTTVRAAGALIKAGGVITDQREKIKEQEKQIKAQERIIMEQQRELDDLRGFK